MCNTHSDLPNSVLTSRTRNTNLLLQLLLLVIVKHIYDYYVICHRNSPVCNQRNPDQSFSNNYI